MWLAESILQSMRPAMLCRFPTPILEHSIGENCISINEENLEKIRSAKRPTTKKEVRSFVGLANYYRDHAPSFAAIAALLSDLTKKGLPESVR